MRKHQMGKRQTPWTKLPRSSECQASKFVLGFRRTAFGILGLMLLSCLELGSRSFVPVAFGADVDWTDDRPLSLPPVDGRQLRVLSPSLLELTLITSKPPDPARPPEWDFVDANLQLHLPSPAQFRVTVAGGGRDSTNHT